MASALPANMTEAERKAMGAQLQAAAYAQPTIAPEGLAMTIIVVTSVIMGIATVVVALRTYVRFPWAPFSKGWGWDDTFSVLSYVSQPPASVPPPFQQSSTGFLCAITDSCRSSGGLPLQRHIRHQGYPLWPRHTRLQAQ